MFCTSCATKNHKENKFCRQCGKKLQTGTKRKLASSASGRPCPECGHVNDPDYKFCGKCGSALDRTNKPALHNSQAKSAVAPKKPHRPAASVRATAGRSKKAGPAAKSAGQASMPQLEDFIGILSHPPVVDSTADTLSLLLDPDVEKPEVRVRPPEGRTGIRSRGTLRHAVAAGSVAAIVFAALLHWGRYESHSSSVKASSAVSAAAAEMPDQPQKSTVPASAREVVAAQAAAEAPAPASRDAAGTASFARSEVATQPQAVPVAWERDSSPRMKTAALDRDESISFSARDAVLRARELLVGNNGFEPNCEQALAYLRAAAQKNDAAAAMQMGSLYASGKCVAKDRVMAYRWLNSAFEFRQTDAHLNCEMERLLSAMTPEERQDAGR